MTVPELMPRYETGHADSVRHWVGKFANCHFDYFARHDNGRPINYDFNSLGYRGHEHFDSPDISVFGSSFSFGVGIEFEQCWHQQLGDHKVNCYAAAGILVTNDDIIDLFNTTTGALGQVIIQLREFRYNRAEIVIPKNVKCFVIDEFDQPGMLNLPWASFIDRAQDGTHPGPLTHQSWAQIIKQTFAL